MEDCRRIIYKCLHCKEYSIAYYSPDRYNDYVEDKDKADKHLLLCPDCKLTVKGHIVRLIREIDNAGVDSQPKLSDL